MTTSSSPITRLKAQADKIAHTVKRSGRKSIKFAVVMDDKTITVDVADVNAVSEKDLAKYVLDLMQGTR